MYHIFFIHFSLHGYSGCFYVLAIVNSAAMNIMMHGSFAIMVFSRYVPQLPFFLIIISHLCSSIQMNNHLWAYWTFLQHHNPKIYCFLCLNSFFPNHLITSHSYQWMVDTILPFEKQWEISTQSSNWIFAVSFWQCLSKCHIRGMNRESDWVWSGFLITKQVPLCNSSPDSENPLPQVE